VGALDMAGNVTQWCEDWIEIGAYERYARGDLAPPKKGEQRVARGGDWSSRADQCRSITRFAVPPTTRSVVMGFRVVLRSDR
jgi:formylglycine-generating enzyme required for sulfatase activity